MGSLQETDDFAAKGATHPRVSVESMENKIKHKFFITGDVLANNAAHDGLTEDVLKQLSVLTICLVVTDSGFTIVDTSAPASPENYTQEKGERFSYEGCIRKMWPFEGYLLREKLHTEQGNTDVQNATDGDVK